MRGLNVFETCAARDFVHPRMNLTLGPSLYEPKGFNRKERKERTERAKSLMAKS
jgi:hypothetical protein